MSGNNLSPALIKLIPGSLQCRAAPCGIELKSRTILIGNARFLDSRKPSPSTPDRSSPSLLPDNTRSTWSLRSVLFARLDLIFRSDPIWLCCERCFQDYTVLLLLLFWKKKNFKEERKEHFVHLFPSSLQTCNCCLHKSVASSKRHNDLIVFPKLPSAFASNSESPMLLASSSSFSWNSRARVKFCK